MPTRFRPGFDAWFACDSPTADYSAVFEDDGETGYLYACRRDAKPHILDACLVYTARDVIDRDKDSVAEITWSTDGLKAGLLINDYLHAVIDFQQRKAWCRTNFPPPGGDWHAESREPWSDDLGKLLA